MANSIQINDLSLSIRVGRPLSFYGKLSQQTLPGIHLQFRVSEPEDIEAVENLLALKAVQVNDPFVQQTYPASFVIHQWSTGNGYVGREYIGEVRALDKAPEYKVIVVEGNKFQVLAAREEADSDEESIFRTMLLQLTSSQFEIVQTLLERGEQPLSLQRVGIDEQPRTARFAGRMYWSKHTEGEETFYKQIVRFIEPISFPVSKVGLALQLDQDILSRMVLALSARFQRLMDELVVAGALSSEQQTALLNDEWKALLEQNRLDQVVRERFRVQDAEWVFKEE